MTSMQKKLITSLGFIPKENSSGVFHKNYSGCGNYCIEVDFDNEKFNYGDLILADSKTTLNFSQAENWVVLECVDRLLQKGYKPQNIKLEKVYPAGHGHSGRLDICVTNDDGSEYLLIECKTYGKEFENAVKKLNKDGGQLFTYFKFSNKAELLMLYASEFKDGKIHYKNEIVKIEDDYRTGDVKDFYEKWSKLTKDNGVFENWVNPYNFESKALTIKDLEEIRQEDSSFIFNRFLEILRHNVVSDKGNAFNRIFTLFLCKIYDEKINEGTDNELDFQWRDGVDDHRSFQLRLTDLYKNGMHEFLEKVVTDFSETEFNNKFKHLEESLRNSILVEFQKIRLEKNNEFAIKDVYDEQSFNENAVVVKEIVQLLEKYKLRYTKKQQYLSDFFELLLTTGLKQESGQFFTPVPIAQFIIKSLPIDKILEEKLSTAKMDNDTLLPYVMDYAAGSGHFLTETMHEMQRLIKQKDDKKYNPSVAKKIRNWQDDHFAWAIQYIYGIEKDYRLVKVGKVGCYLHGDGLANVIHSDGLARFNHPDYKGKLLSRDKDFPQDNKQFEILVSNPPYSVSAFKNSARSFYKEADFELYDRLTDNSSEIECLFIERAKQLLKDGGVAGIILPSSILSGNSGIYSRSREIILQYFDIIAIAELGSNTFMATGTNTVTLFLRRRNNYDSINLRKAVEKFFNTSLDVTINGIEKPVAKFIEHVWGGISFDDYLTLLQKTPNNSIIEHNIYKEYKKKIKAKSDKEFWNTLLERETDKLYYFIIAYNQKVVLVKSGEKDEEKRFLGYEFSNRRGSEGIHSMQRGKSIEECTQLFDPEVFDNPSKASTYIYKAFQGDFDFPIDSSVQKNVTRHNLVEMLAFDRAEFDKGISLSIKKKVKIESKWEQVLISNAIVNIKGETTKIEKFNILKQGKYPVITQEKENLISGYSNSNKPITDLPVVLFGDHSCSLKYIEFPFFRGADGTVLLKPNEKFIPKYFYYTIQLSILQIIENRDKYERHYKYLQNIYIPLPPEDIQKRIISDIEKLEKEENKLSEEISKLKKDASDLLDFKGEMVALESITSKIGSGSTPRGGESSYIESGVTLIRSQNVYDNEFYPKGIAFIDTDQAKKLDGVTVEENDILFNITGASVCRCCIVDKSYLPARVNQHVAIIRTNGKALPKFVQQLLVSTKFKSELLALADSSSTREAITKAQLEDFKIPLPEPSEQQKIVTQIEVIEVKLSKLEDQITLIPKQKEAVLKKYLK